MKSITVRLRCPEALSVASLARALEALGVWVEAVPQHGTGANCHATPITNAKVLPFASADRRWPAKSAQQ